MAKYTKVEDLQKQLEIDYMEAGDEKFWGYYSIQVKAE